MRRILMVLVVLGIAAAACIEEHPSHSYYEYATAQTELKGPVELVEQGDEALFLVTVTVGPDSPAFERDSGSIGVGFAARPSDDFDGDLVTTFVDTSRPEIGEASSGAIYPEGCVDGCVRVFEVTVTWRDDGDGYPPRGLPPGVPLEFTYLANASYLLPEALHQSVFDGVALPEDLSIEVELISLP